MIAPDGSPETTAARKRDDRRVMALPASIGAVVLFALGAFAWRYYLERTACFDSAFFSWLMIDGGHPTSVLGRYGSWVAQLLPVALIQLGAPLTVVLKAYSISFIAFHALLFYVVTFRLKDLRAAMVLPVVLTAGFHYMFYFGISELYQGLSITIVLWVLIRRAWDAPDFHHAGPWMIAAFLVNVCASFFHQLLVLPLIFLLVFETVEARRWKQRNTWLLAIALLGWYAVRIAVMPASTYEEARMPKVMDLITYAFKLGELNSTIYFLMVWTKFKALLILMGAAGVLALWQRAWLRLAWTTLFTAGFLVLILIVDRDGMAPVIYENYYPVIGLVWGVLFASCAVRLGATAIKRAFVYCAVVCGLGLLQIHRGHYRLTDRVEYAQRITTYREAQGERKSLVRFHNYPWYYGLVHWAAGMESALCSGVRGPEKAATVFVTADVAMLDTVAQRPDQFLGPDWMPTWFKLVSVDQRFFDFPQDRGYTWANAPDTTFEFSHLEMVGPADPYRMIPDRFTVVPIVLHNRGTSRMPTCSEGGDPYHLVFTTYTLDGKEYQRGSAYSSLETDLAPGTSYTQGLVVERPVDKGRYTVHAQLLLKGKVIGPEVRFQIVVDGWPF